MNFNVMFTNVVFEFGVGHKTSRWGHNKLFMIIYI